MEEKLTAKKKKKRKPQSAMPLVILAIAAGILVLLTVVGAGVAFFLTRPDPPRKDGQANAQPQDPAPLEKDKWRGDMPKNPKSLLGRARAKGDRAKLDNEMRQIAIFFNQYCIEAPSPGARTVDGFLNYIRRDSNVIYSAIKEEKFYTVNVKAQLSSDSIIAYETEPYDNGYYCIKSNGFIGIVPEKEWKASLGVR